MSSEQVKQIIQGIESKASSVLGANWKLLEYKYDVSQNHAKMDGREGSYGCIPGFSSFVSGVLCSIDAAQTFTLILTKEFVNQDYSDDNVEQAIFDLYNQVDKISVEVHKSKLGIPSVVTLVDFDSVDEPELLDDNLVVLRANYTVRYRSALNF